MGPANWLKLQAITLVVLLAGFLLLPACGSLCSGSRPVSKLPVFHSPVVPYRTPQGRTIGRHRTGRGSGSARAHGFAQSLERALRRHTPRPYSSNSPLVRLRPLPRVRSHGRPWPPGGGSPIRPVDPNWPTPGPGPYSYQVVEVGKVDRAPMAMFAHQGELVISGISRNGMERTPVWTYREGEGVRRRSFLPGSNEAGAAGFSTGSEINLTPESWGGPVLYTAPGPEGPWTKHDFTRLVPHEYKNLKWGFSYRCPATGRRFMGFGNADHPGMVLHYSGGEWKVLAAPQDMRYPTGVAAIPNGPNQGATVVSSSTYGLCRVHLVGADGSVRKIMEIPDWGFVRADHANRIVYLAGENGRVYWASFDNPGRWKECKYVKPSGPVDHIEKLGIPNLHPKSGRMIFPTRTAEGDAMGVYEARREGGDIVLHQVAWLPGTGEWTAQSAVVNGQLYLGSGLHTGQAADRTPGVIYKLEASPARG